jgi:hypothetical protein
MPRSSSDCLWWSSVSIDEELGMHGGQGMVTARAVTSQGYTKALSRANQVIAAIPADVSRTYRGFSPSVRSSPSISIHPSSSMS